MEPFGNDKSLGIKMKQICSGCLYLAVFILLCWYLGEFPGDYGKYCPEAAVIFLLCPTASLCLRLSNCESVAQRKNPITAHSGTRVNLMHNVGLNQD